MELSSQKSFSYGWRAKIGVIVPPTNTVNEAEWNFMCPEGVSIHAARMPLHSDISSAAGKRALYKDVEEATRLLIPARLNAIAYGCTAGSMLLPLTELSDFMEGLSKKPCVTTAASIVNALKELGVTNIALATPYHEELNLHEVEFLKRVGIFTKHQQGLGIGAGGPHEYINIAQTPAEDIYQHIVSADRPNAEAILVSCTDFPVLNMISDLEKQLGKPLITSNQATFWAILRASGIDDQFNDFGTLLKEH